LNTYEIYNINNELFFKTLKNELESYKSKTIYPAGDITLIYKDYLINLIVGENSTQNLNLYSISKKSNVYKKAEIISFSIKDDQLSIYTFDSVSKFNLD
jgi:predicted transcriptional regulator